MTHLIVVFAVESEAARAATQLRAAGVPDQDVRITGGTEGAHDRDDEVGVPDSAASTGGLLESPLPPAQAVTMTVDLSHGRLDRAELLALLHAAGGRTLEE